RLLRALEAGRQGDLLPTRQLDWRCDIFSLAAMLRRHLPADGGSAGAWTRRRDADARALVDRLFEAHDGAPTAQRPHRELIEIASAALRDSGLASSLARGWQLAADTGRSDAPSPTPITRIALPVVAAPQERIAAKEAGSAPLPLPVPAPVAAPAPGPARDPAPARAAALPRRVTAPAPRPAKSRARNRKTTAAAKPVVVARRAPVQITPAPKPWGPASKLTPPPVTVAAAPEPAPAAAPTPPAPTVVSAPASTPAPAPVALPPATSFPQALGARAHA